MLAEDEKDLAEAIEAFLGYHHFTVDAVHDGVTALDLGRDKVYDALILDIMMPGKDGIEVLRELRASGVTTPVMMLTAKGRTSDRIEGFDAGADDYIPKPFSPDELLSRLRALMRRGESYTPSMLAFGDVSLDMDRSELICGDLQEQLSRRELQIVELLMRNPKRTFSAEEMLEKLWGWDADVAANVVWVHISNLRKALKNIGSGVAIKAQRGLGYRLEYDEKGVR